MESSRDDFVIAIRSAFLKKGAQQKFSLLSLLLFSIIFLVAGSFNFKVIEFNKMIIKEAVYYSSFIVTIPENVIKKAFNKTSEHFEYYDKFVITQSQLQDLKNKDLSKKIITFENIELKKLIDDYFIEDSQVYAKVLIDKESPFLRSIVINKGSKNNVKIGMIVFDDIYLIGKVVEVNYLTSRVLLISDINSKVPVTIQPINTQAIMSGLSEQKGKLQYIKGEKFKNTSNKDLVVLTSGSGGVFKGGIPIGKINLANSSIKDEDLIEVDFYRNFSQLKYVRISSYKKESITLDQSNKKIFEAGSEQILLINNQKEDIKVLQQKIVITEEIRNKFEKENTLLKENLIKVKIELKKLENNINEIENNEEELKFLTLNLLHGPKCRKRFLKPDLFIVGSIEYRACVLEKEVKKKN